MTLSREMITTLLDLAALLAVAVGATAAVWLAVGAPAVAVGGLVLYGGARLIEHLAATSGKGGGAG
ncbi:hypothetical protein [Saccharothrix lopnurensis]|uniref:Uncharacterized protein n=1 Tax=Saccharothrix lopnurensis TaxID=1670621 RepID=A0ABW1P446_9PSEU